MTGDGTSEGCDGEEKMLRQAGFGQWMVNQLFPPLVKIRIAHKLNYIQNSKELWSVKKYFVCFTFLSREIWVVMVYWRLHRFWGHEALEDTLRNDITIRKNTAAFHCALNLENKLPPTWKSTVDRWLKLEFQVGNWDMSRGDADSEISTWNFQCSAAHPCRN